MPSRRPPSQRDPQYAIHRAPATLRQVLPGAAVKNAKLVSPPVPARVTAPSPIFLEAIVRAGAAAVGTNLIPPGFRVPASCLLTAVYVNVGTAPVGAALTVLVNRAGALLASVSVASSATSGAATGLMVKLSKGDMLTVDISAIGSTTPGSDVLVSIEAA